MTFDLMINGPKLKTIIRLSGYYYALPAIEIKEIGTPLTEIRYTGNYRGAIYGYDQTMDNSGQNRIGHSTPVKNLYLSGAWSRVGHGYGAVLGSGLQCFAEIMQNW